ncbi:DUF1501 domain-containing protein [Kolteria novifilia]
MSGWLPALAADGSHHPDRKRACILLWMSGGASQTDTFDMKPGHANGGPFKEVATSATGLRFSEHLPHLAKMAEHLVPIRSMKTKEGDHLRASQVMKTGYPAQGPISYPTMGSLLSKELASPEVDLPSFVSIAPNQFLGSTANSPGFLGPKHAPLVVGNGVPMVQNQFNDAMLKVQNLDAPRGVDLVRANARLGLLDHLEEDFASVRPGIPTNSHRTAYEQAVRMMRSSAIEAFDLGNETDQLRDRYGRNIFGQSCLLARRLVERGVPFVEVALNGINGSQAFGWDTHRNNFDIVKNLCGVLDPAWATLINDLKTHDLLDSTLVVWMGEFGRTPIINNGKGRDHFPAAWTTVLAGGGVRGGQAYGKTSKDGGGVVENPVSEADLIATICHALGIDPMDQNMSNVGRPIRIADPDAKPIEEILS